MRKNAEQFKIAFGWGDEGYRAFTDKNLASNMYCAVNRSIAWEKALMALPKNQKLAYLEFNGERFSTT